MVFMRPIAFFDGVHGRLAAHDDVRGAIEIITTRAKPGQTIRIDDGRIYPQLCEDGRRTGRPLEWAIAKKHMGRDFARDCGARLYKKREGYEGAIERMKADVD
jgi:hypothetical protein